MDGELGALQTSTQIYCEGLCRWGIRQFYYYCATLILNSRYIRPELVSPHYSINFFAFLCASTV